MITRINQFEAKSGLEDKLFEFLRSVIATIEKSPGCKSCRLLRSAEHPAHLAIIEEWASIQDHQNAAKAIPPEQMAKAMALFARPPTGMYYKS
jgi:quinol monooxygenase YgiN